MADKDYQFLVYSSDLRAYGPVGKENMDITRLIFDFTEYLESAETISSIDFPTIGVAPNPIPQNWRQDYPAQCAPAEDLVDTYPLVVLNQSITGLGKHVEVQVNAGTPEYTYVLSFLITASTTQRRKQMDTLIRIEVPLNEAMLSSGDVDPFVGNVLIIGGSTALPMGFAGMVLLNNTNTANITVTLPPNPSLGQYVEFIDVNGTDGAYPVTFIGPAGVPIDGDGRTSLVSDISYDWLGWAWTGAKWHLATRRFGLLAV